MSRPVPPRILDAELTLVLRKGLRWYMTALRGDEADRGTGEFIRVRASQWAWYGVPSDMVFGACKLVAETLWQTLEQTVDPARLSVLSPPFFEATHKIYTAVAEGYIRPGAGRTRMRDDRQRLARTLVDGLPAHAVADELGLRLANSYAVVACSPLDATRGPTEGGRRFWSVVADSLLHEPRTLYLDTERSELLLVPCEACRDEGGAVRVARDLYESARAAGAPILGGVAWSPRDDVPRAASEADEVLRVVGLLGRGPGMYELRDVVVECALFRAPDLTRRLAAMVEPLELNGPDLLTTLRAFLGSDLDRRRAARALQIHTNTLDYRLRRIRELTGAAPSTPRGAQVLGAAIVARQLGAGGNRCA